MGAEAAEDEIFQRENFAFLSGVYKNESDHWKVRYRAACRRIGNKRKSLRPQGSSSRF